MNTKEVLANVNTMIADGEAYKESFGWSKNWNIRNVYKDLGIFDWWSDKLSVTQLKQMRKFLETAEKLGFNGYVCFKVGMAGCAHGMWAHKAESTTGYSPDGECLYHSFRSGDNYWDYCNEDNKWMGNEKRYGFTLADVKEAMWRCAK